MTTCFCLVFATAGIALGGAPSLAATLPGTAAEALSSNPRIAVGRYQEKVYGSWLGQITGNIYGLSYEFRFIDEPGPDAFPYGFGASLERIEEVDGAFSDDDTDIEYMYLRQMERHGIEPTYGQLADARKYHVRDRVWVANRSALALMHAGYSPPLTGHRDFNPNWFQIDPTIHYAAMYAAAFFEDDVERLIDIGTSALPAGSRFAATVEHMKRLHRQHPDDWRAARQAMAQAYYGSFDYNRHAWPVVDANLNGACAILALLYGKGDFQRTLDMASGLGFDADNQARDAVEILHNESPSADAIGLIRDGDRKG